jgi:hypothetical protein
MPRRVCGRQVVCQGEELSELSDAEVAGLAGRDGIVSIAVGHGGRLERDLGRRWGW